MRIRYLALCPVLLLLHANLTGYTLSISKTGTGSGSLKVNGTARTLPFSHDYAAGFHLTIEAVPATGSKFENWGGSGMSGSTNPVSFDMPAANINATARFSLVLVPDIDCNPASHDFQPCFLGMGFETRFEFYNVGNSDLIITSWTITGANASEFVSSPGNDGVVITLTPGQSGLCRVGFFPATVGNKSAVLNIWSNDPDENPFHFNLSGSGSPPGPACNPASWDYGAVNLGSNAVKTFVFSNAGTACLYISKARLTGTNTSEFSIQNEQWNLTLDPGETYNFTVQFSPATAGNKSAVLNIENSDPKNSLFNISLSGTGTTPGVTAPDIASDPASWDYGSVNPGSNSEKTFVVSNTGNASLNVTTTTLTGADASEFSIQSGGGAFTLAPGATRNIVLRFSPASAGNKSASLGIASDDPDENPFTISLSGTGAGGGGGFSIIVDGIKDNFYTQLTGPDDGYIQIRSYAWNDMGKPVNDADLSAKVCVAWDDQWFYLYEEVTDHILSGSSAYEWNNDGLELMVDPQPTDSVVNSVFQSRLTALGLGSADAVSADDMNSIENSRKKWFRKAVPGGYVLELAIGWPAFASASESITPFVGNVFGFAIRQPDNDGGGVHRSTIEWAAVLLDGVWNTPKYLGTVKFLADHKLQFIARNNMTGKTNPVPYDGRDYTRTRVEKVSMTHDGFSLDQNYPNPFNPSTMITFNLPSRSFVSLKVFDFQGREMATLVSEELSAGNHSCQWNAANLPGGVYVCRLQAGSVQETRKLVLLK
jgi:hypothetical protein